MFRDRENQNEPSKVVASLGSTYLRALVALMLSILPKAIEGLGTVGQRARIRE